MAGIETRAAMRWQRFFSLPRRASLLLLLLIAVAAPLWHLHVIDRDMPMSQSDLLPRWVGTRAALQGKDPYSSEVLRQIQIAYYGRPLTSADHADPQAFLYPAHIVILLAPLAHFSWQTTRFIYLCLAFPLLAWSFWACMRYLDLRLTPHQTQVVLILACFSWPVMWGLRLQQPTLVLAALVLFALSLLARGKQYLAGILLAIATVKPQILLPLLLWLLLWAVAHRLWALIGSFAFSLASLLYATEQIVPGWFSSWYASLHGYSTFTRSVPPLEVMFGHWVGLVFTVVAVGWGAVSLWRLRMCPANSREFGIAVSLTLAVAVDLAPTHATMIYNHVFLFPSCLFVLFSQPEGRIASRFRRLTIAQIALGLVSLPLAAGAELLFRPWPFLTVLPFIEYLLPVLLTVALASGIRRSDVLPVRIPAETNLHPIQP